MRVGEGEWGGGPNDGYVGLDDGQPRRPGHEAESRRFRGGKPVVGWAALTAAAAAALALIDRHDAMAAAVLLVMSFALVCAAARRAPRPTRIIVLGRSHSAASLAAELDRHSDRLQLVGRVATEPEGQDDDLWLGPLSDLCALVQRHDVDLLLLGRGVPRMEVFDELERSCLGLGVRVCELASFYEDHFGHIPIAEINSAWFQCVLHPRYDPVPPRSKRVFDVVVAALLGLTFAPLLILLALVIRRDGGPALYRQLRIGEQGRPFTMLKLRTMRVWPEGETSWSTANDERVTRIGALLRRSHLDELPQILNVLRGEMSIVGPRPEQPQYVEQLELSVPFYSRRHQLRPGLTGWAQLHCGYGGSERGAAWKLSHDLYYLRHRSLRLDVRILLTTLKTPFSPHQFGELQPHPLVFDMLVEDPEPELQVAVGQ
jgi:exopolysaccharide biosynthesis polyprenyl glycosylphosphotransferase